MERLLDAAASHSIETLQYLVSVGADVNVKNKDGKIPLDVINEDDENAEEKKQGAGIDNFQFSFFLW